MTEQLNTTEKRAVILLSGGLDSATVVAMARAQGYSCYTMSFDYGQRSHAELHAAARVARDLGVVEHKVIGLNLNGMGGSALTDTSIDIPEELGEGIPVTYVPARNTVFLSLALGWAEVLGARHGHNGRRVQATGQQNDCVFFESVQLFGHISAPARHSTDIYATATATAPAGCPPPPSPPDRGH